MVRAHSESVHRCGAAIVPEDLGYCQQELGLAAATWTVDEEESFLARVAGEQVPAPELEELGKLAVGGPLKHAIPPWMRAGQRCYGGRLGDELLLYRRHGRSCAQIEHP